MSNLTTIVKRNGEVVKFDPDKLNKWAEWAADINVDWSSVVLEACRKCFDGCSSTELHQAMIDSCIDQETSQHLKMAGRLYIGQLIKDVFGDLDNVPTLSQMYNKMVRKGLWAKMSYSESDLQYLNTVIDHSLDFDCTLTEIKQITEKYAIVDKVDRVVMETPQFVYMRMAMGNMEKMPKHRRLEDVVKLYTYLSQKKINAPTPFFINLGTPKKQYASCFPSGTLVDIVGGQKEIQDVDVSDEVTTMNGQYVKVKTLTYRHYEGDLYSFDTAQTFDNVFSTRDHKFLVKSHKNKQATWVEAKDIKKGMWLSMPLLEDSNHYKTMWDVVGNELSAEYWELNNGVIGRKNKDIRSADHSQKLGEIKNAEFTPELFRLFGYFLAEGHLNQNSNVVGWTFAAKDRIYAEDVVSLVGSLFGMVVKIRDDESKDNCVRVILQQKVVWKFFAKLFGFGAENKADLTGKIALYSKDFQSQLLIGYLRGDGTAVKDGFRSCSVSKNLTRLLRNACFKLGIVCSVSTTVPRGGYANAKKQYILRLNVNDKTEFCSNVGKDVQKINFNTKKQPHNQQTFYDTTVFTKVREIVKKSYSGIVYDIEVDDYSHSFTVDDFIVHNCCVTTTNDTAASLAAADHIAYMMTCASAGIGSHIKTRSKGAKVRNGLITHLGKLPYYKVAQAAVGANLQHSRGGAMTMHYNALDPEIMDLLSLKSVQAVEQKRIKDIDYSFGFNEEFARRVAKNEQWMLVDYSQCPELYESMYDADQSNFIELYNKVEKDDTILKTFVSARDVALKALKEGVETGRIYLHRTDEMNRHTPFKDKIYSSNLC